VHYPCCGTAAQVCSCLENMPAAPTSTHIQGVFDFSGTELGQTAVPPVSCRALLFSSLSSAAAAATPVLLLPHAKLSRLLLHLDEQASRRCPSPCSSLTTNQQPAPMAGISLLLPCRAALPLFYSLLLLPIPLAQPPSSKQVRSLPRRSKLLLFFFLPLTSMLLLSIHPFGRFFFLQIYILWSVVGSDGFSPNEPARFPHRSQHSPPLQPDPAKVGIRPGSSGGSRCTLPPSVALRGSGRCLPAWTFPTAVADSPVFLTELTRFQSFI
jgi:hypothetical protein